jgi:hypothetical protein
MLSDFAPEQESGAISMTSQYPEENKAGAYRCLGTFITKKLLKDSNRGAKLEEFLTQVPNRYIKDFVYGVVRVAQWITTNEITEHDFQPFRDVLTKRYAATFYESWGYRHLGYKYYDVLLNRKILLGKIPVLEQWFFKNFLDKFKVESSTRGTKDLMEEINQIPLYHQYHVVTGIGKLMGAEMLLDPLHTPDYPLDSSFGEHFSGPLREAFYEGVGRGFAETLCRFWRMLLIPEHSSAVQRKKLLDLEWDRYKVLIAELPQSHYFMVQKGFFKELQSRDLSPSISNYIHNKFTESN